MLPHAGTPEDVIRAWLDAEITKDSDYYDEHHRARIDWDNTPRAALENPDTVVMMYITSDRTFANQPNRMPLLYWLACHHLSNQLLELIGNISTTDAGLIAEIVSRLISTRATTTLVTLLNAGALCDREVVSVLSADDQPMVEAVLPYCGTAVRAQAAAAQAERGNDALAAVIIAAPPADPELIVARRVARCGEAHATDDDHVEGWGGAVHGAHDAHDHRAHGARGAHGAHGAHAHGNQGGVYIDDGDDDDDGDGEQIIMHHID